MSNTLYEKRIEDGFTGVSATVAGREYFAAGKVGGYVDVYLVVDGEKIFVDFGVWKDGAIRETGCGGVGVDANVLEVLTLRLAAAFSPVPPAKVCRDCGGVETFCTPTDRRGDVNADGWSCLQPVCWNAKVEPLAYLVEGEVRESGLVDEKSRRIGACVNVSTRYAPARDLTFYSVSVHATRNGTIFGATPQRYYFETADAALECANTLVARSFKRYARTFGGAK